MLAMTAPKAAGAVMNLACGERTSLNTVLEQLSEIVGAPVEADHCEPRAGDVKRSQAAIEKARELLGFEPAIGFREGLQRTFEDTVERRSAAPLAA